MDDFKFDFKEGMVIVEYVNKEYGEIQVKLPLIMIAEKAAASTDNKLDDKFVAMVKEALS